MLETEMIQQRGFRNTIENNEIVGFQLAIRQVDYRGTWLSQLRIYGVEVDGEFFDTDLIKITISGVDYDYDELSTLGRIMWQLNEVAIVKVSKKGGLTQGEHKVSVFTKSIKSYLPPRFDTMGERDVNEHNTRNLLIV